MPFRIRFLVAFLLASIAFARADEKIITGAFDLKALSTYLPSSPDRSLTVRIDNYVNPGQLKIDQSSANLDTLLLQRFSPDSDGVINVDSTFIDIKGFPGTLILKNLAFRLKARATLIAGFDLNRPNHNLILDSCYLYADTLDGTFLSWEADTLSQVIIRNSWFVADASKAGAANIQITTGSASLSNNLFNFAGTFTAASITSKFEALSNTVNRMQFKLSGDILGGVAPSYDFSQNLIAFHGSVNAFMGNDYFVMKASGFNEPRSSIQGNRMYSVWKGFDVPAGTKGMIGNKIDTLVNGVSTLDGKSATELWDWYTETGDPNTGMLSGNSTLRRFNVLPGRTFVDTVIGGDPLRVTFKSADYPRAFHWNLGAPPALQDSAFRLRAVLPGRISFGAFQVDNILDSATAKYGKPILLAQSATGLFLPQSGGSRSKEAPSIFQNQSPRARVFALVDSGNTPHGPDVEPVPSSAAKFEHLRFAKVIDAGETDSKWEADGQMPDSLRSLQRIFGFNTSATVNTAVTFASSPGTQPWARPGDGALYWYWKSKDTLIPAVQGTIWGDSLLYGSFHYSNADGTFIVHLVEKLSVHAGANFHLEVPGATVISNSTSGYQLYVDTSSIDPGRFGSATKGYKFTSNGRGAGDSLFLILKSPAQDARVFVKVPSKPEADSLSLTADSAGNFRISIDVLDTGKVFFAGVKYNVLAGAPFSGVVNGVTVDKLYSTTPGRIAYRDLSRSDAVALASKSDSVFHDTRFLGGIQDASSGLTITRDYALTFGITQPFPSDSAEIWALEAGTWIKLGPHGNVSADTIRVPISLSSLPAPTAIVVLERFKAPENYVKPVLISTKDSLVVSLDSMVAGNPVSGYCVVVRTIDTSGNVKDGDCQVLPLNAHFSQPLDPSLGYAYRVDYVMGSGKDTATLIQQFRYPTASGWDAKAVFANSGSEAKNLLQSQWRLVAMPVDTLLSRLLVHGKRIDTAGIIDETLVLGLTSSGKVKKTQFDTLARANTLAGVRIKPTTGILVASSHPIAFSLDGLGSAVQTAKPETLTVDSGWNLIGNPFPINLRKECVTPSTPHTIRLWKLSYDPRTKYAWPELTSALAPFTGYAYNAPFREVLSFDPACPVAAPKKAATAGASARIKVGIHAAFGTSDMSLVRSQGEYAIGFLPAPAAGLELRVGGGDGYWIKPVADPGRIDEPVEIRSAQAGPAAFTVNGGSGSATFALTDLATGMVYDAAAARALSLRAGTQAYRLLAGDPAFVAAGIQSFRSAAPAEISLSQNFPNPVRGLTRIAVDWPSTAAQDRQAYLEVIDLEGRRVAMQRIEAIQVGRQLLVLDAKAWKPGLYVYRLIVSAGGHVARFQKRMLVVP